MSDGKSENLKKAEDTNSSSIETIYELIKSGKLEEAKKYIPMLKQSADGGIVRSQHFLGLLLLRLNNEEDGIKYLEMAAKEKYLLSIRSLLSRYTKILNSALKYSEDYLRTVRYKRYCIADEGAELGDHVSIFYMGRIYLSCSTGNKWIDEKTYKCKRFGYTYLYEAAARGYVEAVYWLARHYYTDDIERANQLYAYAAKCGHGKSLLEMAKRYDEGIGVEQNFSEARRLADLAKESGIKIKESDFNSKTIASSPSLTMPSGINGVPDKKLPDFLYKEYKNIVDVYGKPNIDVKEETKRKDSDQSEKKSGQTKKLNENKPKKKVVKEHKQTSQNKDAAQGCGCLLAIIALVAFGIWWWIEGFSMSAITDLWKSANKDGSLGTAVMVLGGLAATFIGWKLLKKNDSGESTSPKKRWKFITLGILFGFFGAHLAYAKRWVLFLLLWAGLICGNVMNEKKTTEGAPDAPTAVQEKNQEVLQEGGAQESEKKSSNPISNAGFAVWGLLWIGGTLFIKKDGNGCRM